MKSLSSVLSLLCLCLAAPPALAAENKFSQITLEFRGDDGEPVRGAEVVFQRWQPEGPGLVFLAKATTDKRGQVTQKLELPADHIPAVKASVKAEGYFPHSTRFLGVEGAHLRKDVELDRERTTTLKFREKDGSPAAHRLFTSTLGTHFSGVFTDAKGEFRFVHRPPERPWIVRFRGERFWVEGSKDAVIEIQPAGLRYLPPGLGLSAFSSHPVSSNTPPDSAPPRVRGKLLLEDGSPALGWRVASKIIRGGGWSVINVPSTIYLEFNYRRLTAVDEEGRFDVRPISTDLVIVSPGGMPFLYPLNPQAWVSSEFVKETSITVPTLSYRKLKLRWNDSDGEPAVGVRIAPRDQGEFYDRWAFGPAVTETEDLRAYAGEDPPPGLASLRLPVSDKNGEIRIPVHPWLKVTTHSWRPDEESAPWRALGLAGKSDGDVVVLQRDHDVPPNKNAPNDHWRPLLCTFKNGQGKKVDADKVHWRLFREAYPVSSGTGGFIEAADGRQSLTESKWTDRVEFSHENRETGKWEYFTATFEQNKPLGPLEVKFSVARKSAIAGTVLNFKNEPEPGVQLHLTRNTHDVNKKYLQLRTTSDEEGKFLFPYGPAECGLYLNAFWEGHGVQLNHLAEHPKITAANRQIEVKLQPVGSVRVKLLGAKILPVQLTLRPEGGDAENAARRNVMLHPTHADGTVFRAPYVLPGRYSLAYYVNNTFSILSDKPIEIRADEETRAEVAAAIEMQKKWLALARTNVPVRVTVMRNGKPVSGAIVRTERAGGWHRGHFASYPGDITDQNGHAQFLAQPGTSVLFAARDHERNIAWGNLPIKGPKVEITLELQPLEKAIPQLPPARYINEQPNNVDRARALLGLYQVPPDR